MDKQCFEYACYLSDFLQTLVKTFEVCDLPVRASKFVARKNWVITGAVSYIDYSVLVNYNNNNYNDYFGKSLVN